MGLYSDEIELTVGAEPGSGGEKALNQAAFTKLLPSLLIENKGHFVLIKNGKQIATSESYLACIKAGTELFPDWYSSVYKIEREIKSSEKKDLNLFHYAEALCGQVLSTLLTRGEEMGDSIRHYDLVGECYSEALGTKMDARQILILKVIDKLCRKIVRGKPNIDDVIDGCGYMIISAFVGGDKIRDGGYSG